VFDNYHCRIPSLVSAKRTLKRAAAKIMICIRCYRHNGGETRSAAIAARNAKPAASSPAQRSSTESATESARASVER